MAHAMSLLSFFLSSLLVAIQQSGFPNNPGAPGLASETWVSRMPKVPQTGKPANRQTENWQTGNWQTGKL
jgi:hypothetical protein